MAKKTPPVWFRVLSALDHAARENTATRRVLKVVEGSNHDRNNKMHEDRRKRGT